MDLHKWVLSQHRCSLSYKWHFEGHTFQSDSLTEHQGASYTRSGGNPFLCCTHLRAASGLGRTVETARSVPTCPRVTLSWGVLVNCSHSCMSDCIQPAGSCLRASPCRALFSVQVFSLKMPPWGCCGDGSVSEAAAMQTWEPEFRSLVPPPKARCSGVCL